MSSAWDFLTTTIALVFSAALIVGIFAWALLLPTVGLLWMIGALP